MKSQSTLERSQARFRLLLAVLAVREERIIRHIDVMGIGAAADDLAQHSEAAEA